MSRLDESIFRRIAVYHGYLQADQLKECLEENRSSAGASDLGQLLLEKGYLTEEQLQKIREVKRKKTRKALRDPKEVERSERSFGQIALHRGRVGLGDLERAILEQERLRRLNLQFRLGEVMVAQGVLPLEEVLEILTEQQKRILLCPSCEAHYIVFNYKAHEEYRCKNCGGPLADPHFLDLVAVDGVIDRAGSTALPKPAP